MSCSPISPRCRWRKHDGFVVDAAKPNGFHRPWSPAEAGEGENDGTIISRPSPPRAKDATLSETDLQADD
jgi:competence protein ComEC